MTPDVAEALKIVAARKPLSRELAERVFLDLMDGKATEAQKGAILLGIATRGETAEEIAGAVGALRARMRKVPSRRSPRTSGSVHVEPIPTPVKNSLKFGKRVSVFQSEITSGWLFS